MNLSVSLSLDKAELRLPASASHCLRLAGRCPNSDSLLPPLAAVVVVAPIRGASGEPGNSELDAGSPIWRKMAGLATEGSSF